MRFRTLRPSSGTGRRGGSTWRRSSRPGAVQQRRAAVTLVSRAPARGDAERLAQRRALSGGALFPGAWLVLLQAGLRSSIRSRRWRRRSARPTCDALGPSLEPPRHPAPGRPFSAALSAARTPSRRSTATVRRLRDTSDSARPSALRGVRDPARGVRKRLVETLDLPGLLSRRPSS